MNFDQRIVNWETLDLDTQICARTDYADQTFENIRLEHTQLVSSEFHDCIFLHCGFVETVFRECRFVNCVFRQCDLSLVKVSDTVFSSVQFEDSKVIGVNWAEADWTTTRFGIPVGFLRCTLNHSTFLGLKLSGLQIRECTAVDVDFRETDLSKADFSGTDLTDSLFGHTNLTEADLSRARNYRLDPGQNILKRARFSLPEAMALLYGLDIVLTEDSV